MGGWEHIIVAAHLQLVGDLPTQYLDLANAMYKAWSDQHTESTRQVSIAMPRVSIVTK